MGVGDVPFPELPWPTDRYVFTVASSWGPIDNGSRYLTVGQGISGIDQLTRRWPGGTIRTHPSSPSRRAVAWSGPDVVPAQRPGANPSTPLTHHASGRLRGSCLSAAVIATEPGTLATCATRARRACSGARRCDCRPILQRVSGQLVPGYSTRRRRHACCTQWFGRTPSYAGNSDRSSRASRSGTLLPHSSFARLPGFACLPGMVRPMFHYRSIMAVLTTRCARC